MTSSAPTLRASLPTFAGRPRLGLGFGAVVPSSSTDRSDAAAGDGRFCRSGVRREDLADFFSFFFLSMPTPFSQRDTIPHPVADFIS
jgi:hypothetical protein